MKHLAVIMDGNGRWAINKGLDRSQGYRYGAEALVRLLEDFITLPLSVLTVYAFSTENNLRNKEEVSNIYSVIASFLLNRVYPFCQKAGIALRFIGNLDKLPKNLKDVVCDQDNDHKANKTFVIAINYGGIDDVCRAISSMRDKKIETIDEKTLLSNLDCGDLPFPDAVLRYGGHKRLSNFMLLQCAYSELFFIEKLWPDYTKEDIASVINEFKLIKRNFGGNNA